MNWGLFSLTFAYLVLMLLLYVVLRHTRWNLLIKAGAIVAVAYLCVLTVRSYPPLMGWPTSIDLPKRFNLVGMTVEEPNKSTQSRGRIFLWVTDMQQQIGRSIPRAYEMPYTAALHNKLNETSKKLRKNLPQLGETTKSRNPMTGEWETDFQFFDMPDPLFPEK